jgi:hypothetical protein
MRDGLGEIAMVLGPVLVDRLLDVSSLFGCASAALFHTIVKSSQAYLQSEECWHPVFRF